MGNPVRQEDPNMRTSPEIAEKTKRLNELAMRYETAVLDFPKEGYLDAFYRFYEMKDRSRELAPSELCFLETLQETVGTDSAGPVAAETERLFGMPKRVLVFEDPKPVAEELEGEGGQGPGPFFFIFDLMFCEFKDCTLCFISGSNN